MEFSDAMSVVSIIYFRYHFVNIPPVVSAVYLSTCAVSAISCATMRGQQHGKTALAFGQQIKRPKWQGLWHSPLVARQLVYQPYSCPTDAFNLYNKGIDSHLIILKPGDMVNFKVRIYSQVY